MFFLNDSYSSIASVTSENPTANTFVHALALCNDASINGSKPSGDPTEIALLEAAQQLGLSKSEAEQNRPRLYEIAFDSKRKKMSTVHKTEEGRIVYVKGALEVFCQT